MRAAIRILGAAMIASLALLPGVAFAATDTDGDGVPDNADAFPGDPTLAAEAYAPAYQQFGQIFFEDLWPTQGDFDFNDETIAYNYLFQLDAGGKLVHLKGSFTVLSAGATYHNRLLVHLPIPAAAIGSVTVNGLNQMVAPVANKPGESEITVEISPDTLAPFGDLLVNTDPGKPSQAGVPFNLLVTLATPTAVDLGQAPFDVFLVRTDASGLEIHLPQYGGTSTMNGALFNTADDGSTQQRHFVTRGGIPFALVVPYAIAWPAERVRIDVAYPDIIPFGASGGATNADWYLTNVNAQSLWTGGANNTPAPVAQIIPPDFAIPTNTCVHAANGTACNDGDACTRQDTCQNGACIGVAYSCPAADACHKAGLCVGDGTCTPVNQADGTVCGSVANGAASCVSGACSGVTCNVGFGNCDGNAGNGCESDLVSSNANCGACGTACGNGFACISGACVALNVGCPAAGSAQAKSAAMTACKAQFANCVDDGTGSVIGFINGSCQGCNCDPVGSWAAFCYITGTDTYNCSACTVGEIQRSHNPCNCAAGTTPRIGVWCGVACNPGFGDCDNNAGNGCEVNVNTDVNNCGACGNVCNLANATSTCSAGQCGVAACNAGYLNCDNNAGNGCEIHVAVDPNNCGACGHVCTAANGVSACNAGQCTLAACNAGFADCDNNAGNGCEVNISNSNTNCGGCGIVCGNGTVCTAGVCVAGGCPASNSAQAKSAAMTACKAQFANCIDDGTGSVIGYINGSCQGCNCDPVGSWAAFCYITGTDTYNCSACTVGEIQRSHNPCNCAAGTTPRIGAWCM